MEDVILPAHGGCSLIDRIIPYKKDRDDARALFSKGDFIEVFIKANLSVCETRDKKRTL